MDSTNSVRAPGRATRAGVFVALAFAVAQSLSAGIASPRLLAAIVRETPRPQLVARGEELRHAETAAKGIPGATAFQGVGASMAPLYSDRTAIVIAPLDFKELKKGMTVVYVNGHGRLVAHVLAGDLPKGWIAWGMNNDEEDDDLVTAENFVGVVVRAYAEMPNRG